MVEKTEIEAKKTRDLHIVKVLGESEVGEKKIKKLEVMASADSPNITPIKWECFNSGLFQHILENEGKAIKAQTHVVQQGSYLHYYILQAFKDGKPIGGYKNHGSVIYTDSPEKIASLETQKAVELVMTSYFKLKSEAVNMPSEQEIQLEGLYKKALDWCESKIPTVKLPPPGGNGKSSLVKTKNSDADPDNLFGEAPPGQIDPLLREVPFKDNGQFMKDCKDILHLQPSEVLEKLSISKATEITDPVASWKLLTGEVSAKKTGA